MKKCLVKKMTKLEQLAELRKKLKQARKNQGRQWARLENNLEVRVHPGFWIGVENDCEDQIETLKRKIGPGDY